MTGTPDTPVEYSETISALLRKREIVRWVEDFQNRKQSKIALAIGTWPNPIRVTLRLLLMALPYIWIFLLIRNLDYDEMKESLFRFLPFFILMIIGAWFAQTKMGRVVSKATFGDAVSVAITDQRVIFVKASGETHSVDIKDITGLEQDWSNGARVLILQTDGPFDKSVVAHYDVAGATRILHSNFQI